MKIKPLFAVLVSLLLVLVLVGTAWWRFGDDKPSPSSTPVKSSVVPMANAESEPPALALVQEPADTPVNRVSAASAADNADGRVWDLCGVGRLPIPPGLPDLASGGWTRLPKHLGEEAQDSGRERLQQAMGQGDARARGAALVLRLGYAQRFARTDSELKTAADAVEQTQQALLALAQGSGDPAVAAWAVASCRTDVACKAKANAVWRQVDPDNATPWMVELDLAQDDPTRALGAIARSARYFIYPSMVAAAALAAMPVDIPPYLQQRLLLDVMRMEDQQTPSHGFRGSRGPIYSLCRSATDSTGQAVAVESTPQAADCRAVSQLFADRSDALDSHTLGLTLGRSTGWPPAEVNERLEQAKLLRNAGMAALGSEPYACAAVDKAQALVRDTASRGEMLALRSLAAEKTQPATNQPARR
jgi:hypothetical protein